MFTQGLDDNAIKWVKQGSAPDHLPLVDTPVLALHPPLSTPRNFLLSPKLLPPPSHFHSGLLARLVAPHGFHGDDDDEDESVASVDMDLGSSDLESSEALSDKASFFSYNGGRPGLVRGSSKENLSIQVPLAADRKMLPPEMFSAQSVKFFTPQVRFSGDIVTPGQMDMGTPSAPPIMETEGERWRGEAQAASAPTSMLQHSSHGSGGVEEGRETLGTVNWAEGETQSQRMSQISSR